MRNKILVIVLSLLLLIALWLQQGEGMEEAPPVWIAQDKFEYPGNDLQVFLDTNEETCKAACRVIEGCVGITTNQSGSVCYIKSKLVGKKANPDRVTFTHL